jgi:hypothetical protein
LSDTAIYRIVSYAAIIPTSGNELLARDDLTRAASERYEHLHDAKLQRLPQSGRRYLEERRPDLQATERELGLSGDFDRLVYARRWLRLIHVRSAFPSPCAP